MQQKLEEIFNNIGRGNLDAARQALDELRPILGADEPDIVRADTQLALDAAGKEASDG